MSGVVSAAGRHAAFKAVLFGLIACNAALYALTGTIYEAIDSVAWLTLLALFLLETGSAIRWHVRGAAVAVHAVRFAAAVAIAAAAIGYVRDEEWLDAVNTGLWIVVIALLESELRVPALVAAYRRCFAAVATALYGGLAVPVVLWAWQGDWFDAYDALLWLAAFAVLEMDVLRAARVPDAGKGG